MLILAVQVRTTNRMEKTAQSLFCRFRDLSRKLLRGDRLEGIDVEVRLQQHMLRGVQERTLALIKAVLSRGRPWSSPGIPIGGLLRASVQ